MKKWIQSSFRNRIFASVLLITLVPILLGNVLLLSYQVRRTNRDQSLSAETLLKSSQALLNGLTRDMDSAAETLATSTVVRSTLRRGSSDSRILYQVLFRQTERLRKYCRVDICLPDGTLCDSTDPEPGEGLLPYWGVLREAARRERLTFRAESTGGIALRAARPVRSFDGGILGFVYSWAGVALGGSIMFLLWRRVVKRYFWKLASRSPKLEKAQQWVNRFDTSSLFMLTLLPFTPSSFMHLAFGISDFDEKRYLITMLLGKGIMVAMIALFGQSLVSSMKNPVYLVLAVLLWGSMYWVSKKFCKKHNLE